MSIHIKYEVQVLVYSLCTGVGLMMIYDLIRFFRMGVRHNYFWINVEDFLYWLYSGVFTFLLLYYQNDGILRFYVIGAVFGGMVLYYLSVSRFLFHLLKKWREYLRIRRKS